MTTRGLTALQRLDRDLKWATPSIGFGFDTHTHFPCAIFVLEVNMRNVPSTRGESTMSLNDYLPAVSSEIINAVPIVGIIFLSVLLVIVICYN